MSQVAISRRLVGMVSRLARLAQSLFERVLRLIKMGLSLIGRFLRLAVRTQRLLWMALGWIRRALSLTGKTLRLDVRTVTLAGTILIRLAGMS